jgi:hypothetical protein
VLKMVKLYVGQIKSDSGLDMAYEPGAAHARCKIQHRKPKNKFTITDLLRCDRQNWKDKLLIM